MQVTLQAVKPPVDHFAAFLIYRDGIPGSECGYVEDLVSGEPHELAGVSRVRFVPLESTQIDRFGKEDRCA